MNVGSIPALDPFIKFFEVNEGWDGAMADTLTLGDNQRGKEWNEPTVANTRSEVQMDCIVRIVN